MVSLLLATSCGFLLREFVVSHPDFVLVFCVCSLVGSLALPFLSVLIREKKPTKVAGFGWLVVIFSLL